MVFGVLGASAVAFYFFPASDPRKHLTYIIVPDPDLRTLTALRRLRRVETDEARRDLGVALAQETALAARDEAMRGELEAARQVSGDFDRDAFSAWWARMRKSGTSSRTSCDKPKSAPP